MSTKKITNLPEKSVSPERAEDVKGGRKLNKFGGKRGHAKKKNLMSFSKQGND